MKKIFAYVAVAAMVAGMTACGAKEEKKDEQKQAENADAVQEGEQNEEGNEAQDVVLEGEGVVENDGQVQVEEVEVAEAPTETTPAQ